MTQGSGSPSSIEVDLEANTPANKDTETEEARLLQLPRDDASNEAVAEKEVSPGESHSKRWIALWLGIFASVSVSLVAVNKSVMMALPLPCLVLCYQNGMTVVINLLCVKTGLLEMKEWRLDEMKKFAVQALILAVSLFLNMVALPRVAVATLLVFKSIQVCGSAAMESALGRASFTFQALLGLAVALGGSILYSSADPYYDMSAYCIMVLWVLVNIGGALYDKQITVEVEQTPVGCSCYKNLLGLPVLLLAATLTGETNKLAGALSTMPMVMWPQVAMSGFLGFGMSLCYSTLNKITSATNITAANTFNKILTTIIGSKLFHESTSIGGGIGLFSSMMGVVYYGYETSKVKLPNHILAATMISLLGSSILLVMV